MASMFCWKCALIMASFFTEHCVTLDVSGFVSYMFVLKHGSSSMFMFNDYMNFLIIILMKQSKRM